MNWLLPAVLVFLVLTAYDGRRKGFIRKSVGLVSWVLTFAVTKVSVPYITEFLKEKTELYRVLQNTFADKEIEALQILTMMGQENGGSSLLADMVLRMAAFLITFLLVGFLVRGIAFSLGIVAKLPVLNGLNRILGMLLGLAEGVLGMWIFFLVVTICVSTELGVKIFVMIADSEILSWLYRHNGLFALL